MDLIVRTQAELDAALARPGYDWIELRSPRELHLIVTDTGTKDVTAYGSATVRAYDSATVRAYDSATVTAYDSATVTAYGSATVRAYDSATVRAYDSATVTAYDSATVRASKYVAIHKHSRYARTEGGVLIDRSALDLSNIEEWAGMHGAKIVEDYVVVFKAVGDDLTSERGFAYPLGERVECDDWAPGDFCGGGLHFSPRPVHAQAYYTSATRFLKCAVPLNALSIIDGNAPYATPKLKAKGALVLGEVDIDGNPV